MKNKPADLLRLLGFAALASLLIACTSSSREDVPPPSDGQDQVASSETVTIYIAEMVDRLELLWDDWPNRVQQALAGLDGVESVDDEWDQDPDKLDLEDLLFVTYDPSKIDVELLLETIKKEGFQAEVR